MGRVKNNVLVKGTAGAIGKEIVYRTIKNKTFNGKFPDMSGVIPSKNQTNRRERFAEAVKFAKSVIKDPAKSAKYKTKRGQTVYHAAIQEYMSRLSPGKFAKLSIPATVKAALQELSSTEAQFRAAAYILEHNRLTNNIYQKMNNVSKATATRHLRELAGLGIIKINGGRGAGAHYAMGSWW
jgi:predicted HTH transcriptional regulator